jgi:hypothetical protein
VACCVVAVLLAACGKDSPAHGDAHGPSRDAAVDAAVPAADAGAAAGASGPSDAAAASDATQSPPPTFGNGLVLTDAAIDALMALTPEQRMQTARCESGPVDSGIGLACTPRGGQCRSAGLTCTADFRGDSGICTRLGCATPEDCGAEASCCTLLQAGGVSLCFPDACYPTTCLELFQ